MLELRIGKAQSYDERQPDVHGTTEGADPDATAMHCAQYVSTHASTGFNFGSSISIQCMT